MNRRAKDRIHVAGARRQREHKVVVAERSCRGRRMNKRIAQTGKRLTKGRRKRAEYGGQARAEPDPVAMTGKRGVSEEYSDIR